LVPNEFVAPELSVVYLVAVKIADIYGEPQQFSDLIGKIRDRSAAYVQHCIPAEVDAADSRALTRDLQLLQECDVDYFDEAYLQLKRFCRIDLQDLELTVTRDGRSQTVTVKPYLTVFDVGIAVYSFWVQGLTAMEKQAIVDLSFINRVQVSVNGGAGETLVSVFEREIRLLLQPQNRLTENDIMENHLCMLFVKDIPYRLTKKENSSELPDAFIAEYKNDIFDIVTLPERYFGVSYEYHQSRTPAFIDHVLTNMSVRNDFPVFLFANRFLGIKIRTGEPDYAFEKRVVFNIVLYTNIVLQLLLLKEINETLMSTVKNLQKVTLSQLIKIRQAIYRYLEEYINTSVQRYEIWRKAVVDAARQVGIPELYNAVEERLNMLNSYMNTAFQRQSNIWFVILNTTFFFSTVFVYLDFITRRGVILGELIAIIILAVLWAIAIGYYYSRYIR
jgi:hypothetical protein